MNLQSSRFSAWLGAKKKLVDIFSVMWREKKKKAREKETQREKEREREKKEGKKRRKNDNTKRISSRTQPSI